MERYSSDADRIRGYANEQYVQPARRSAGRTVRIQAGNIVKGLGLKNKTPNVCTALRSRKFMTQFGLELLDEQGPPSGMSTTVIFTYRLLKKARATESKAASLSAFDGLRGIGKKTFKSVGGGEAFIRAERQNFYGTGTPGRAKRG